VLSSGSVLAMNRSLTSSQCRIELAPLPTRRFRNSPVATIDGENIRHAVAGKVPETQLVHRKGRALHGLPVWVRERRYEPLAVPATPEGVRRRQGDSRPMVAHIGTEPAEGNILERRPSISAFQLLSPRTQ